VKVYVKTPARLHLGLIDLNGDLGRMFGGIGVGIDRPNIIVEAEQSDKMLITGEENALVTTLTKRFFDHYSIKSNVHINVKQTIPAHTGLGSGTQLALAVATALAKILNLKTSLQDLAITMGRVQRTGVGTAIFEKGGFVVDGGKTTKISSESVPPLIFRQPFPKEWRFIIVIPNTSKGLSGKEEKAAITQLPPMPAEEVGKMCRLTMMKLLPALAEQNIENFGEALTNIQIITGKYFAKAQGGIYNSPTAQECIELLHKLGAYGAGQSSWGPTLYAVVKKEQAKQICTKIHHQLGKDVGGQVFVAKANNKGAKIRLLNS
jgi:beta-RFAP synthase